MNTQITVIRSVTDINETEVRILFFRLIPSVVKTLIDHFYLRNNLFSPMDFYIENQLFVLQVRLIHRYELYE